MVAMNKPIHIKNSAQCLPSNKCPINASNYSNNYSTIQISYYFYLVLSSNAINHILAWNSETALGCFKELASF